jgi:hypothetical protein
MFFNKGNEMKKSLIALAILAATGLALADSVTGSVTSSVNGGTNVYSTISGVGSASHGAFSAATNTTSISGFTAPGVVGTTADSVGCTTTLGSGVGDGFANAWANQSGTGSVAAAAAGLGATSQVSLSSGSSVLVNDAGSARSGTTGEAFNQAGASVSTQRGSATANGFSTSPQAQNFVSGTGTPRSDIVVVGSTQAIGTYNATVTNTTVGVQHGNPQVQNACGTGTGSCSNRD